MPSYINMPPPAQRNGGESISPPPDRITVQRSAGCPDQPQRLSGSSRAAEKQHAAYTIQRLPRWSLRLSIVRACNPLRSIAISFPALTQLALCHLPLERRRRRGSTIPRATAP